MKNDRVQLLLIDDDDVYTEYFRRLCRRASLDHTLIAARDGAEALEILRGRPGEPPLSRPILIVLDINMPGMDGHEFMAELRRDDALKDLLVFVVTTSGSERDRKRAYARNVAGYIVKDEPEGSLADAVEMLRIYSDIVQLP